MTAKIAGRPSRRLYALDDISIEELLGRIIITWNNFEAMCRDLLCDLCGNPPGIKSLTNELNGSSLYFALRSAAEGSAAPETREIVERLAEGLNRLNEHRNYYVHGASSRDFSSGSEMLVLKTSYAKGEIRVYEDRISKQEMLEISEDCAALSADVFNLVCYLRAKTKHHTPVFPDMPFLPPKLKKSRRG